MTQPVEPPTPPWRAEREVAEDEARLLIASHAPQLAGAELTPLGAGWDNTAWRVTKGGEAFVFRFPRRAVAVSCMEAELLALPILPALPLDVTRPLWSGRMPVTPGAHETWPFAGYRFLEGAVLATAPRPPAPGPLGRALGAFLRALHGLDPRPWLDLGLGRDPIARLDVARRLPPVLEALGLVARDGLDTGPHRAALEGAMATAVPPIEALCHGDLDPRHVLIDGGHVSGLIDWGDVNVGHPAMDLGLAFALPLAAREAFFSAYGAVDEVVATLARARAVMSAARVYAWALDIGAEDLRGYARAALGHAVEG